MGIMKYLVTSLMTSLAPSKSGAYVACKDEATTFCRLLSLTQITCFSRLASEMAGRKEFETRIFCSLWTRQIVVICKIKIWNMQKHPKRLSCRTGWVWINVLIIDQKPPPLIPDRAFQCVSTTNLVSSSTREEVTQLYRANRGSLTRGYESPSTCLLVSALLGWFWMQGSSDGILLLMSGMCQKFWHDSIFFATFWLNSITCLRM